MERRFPLVTVILAGLILACSALALNQIIPDAKSLYLDSRLLSGASLWSPFTYWLFVDKAPSMILALLPLFLFGTTVERRVSRLRYLVIFFGGVLFASLVFAFAFSGLGVVKAASGALCGGASLCGAALVLSATGRTPQTAPGQLPLWVIALLFLAGLVWSSAFVPEAIYQNVTFRTSGFFIGAIVALFSLKNIPRTRD